MSKNAQNQEVFRFIQQQCLPNEVLKCAVETFDLLPYMATSFVFETDRQQMFSTGSLRLIPLAIAFPRQSLETKQKITGS